MPATPATAAERTRLASAAAATICVSSQIGCAVNCQFCMTALLGVQRNLTAGEIVGQVLLVLERPAGRIGRDRINLVFMGQGEPFLNYDNFMTRRPPAGGRRRHSRIAHDGLHLRHRSAHRRLRRRAGASPAGDLASTPPTTSCATAIMPINRKWKLEELLEAAAPVPAPHPRAPDLRICPARRRERRARRCPRSGRRCSRGIRAPRSTSSPSIPARRFRSRRRPPQPWTAFQQILIARRHPRLPPPSARARHLRRLRPAQAHHRAGTVGASNRFSRSCRKTRLAHVRYQGTTSSRADTSFI